MTDRWGVPQVLLWGTAGIFAYRVFQALLNADISIVGLVLPGASGTGWHQHSPPRPPASDVLMLPSFVTHGLVERAWEEAIPVYRCGGSDKNPRSWNETIAAVAEIAPTVIVVACWHTQLPDSLLALPQWGGMNLHPSLLPDFRGPVPLFWQRRAGLQVGGITIHAMTQEWDAGEIYSQSTISFPDGATMDELDHLTGSRGGSLLVEVINSRKNGMVCLKPQPPGGTYHSFPKSRDFTIPQTWTTLHAWNFMRVAESFGVPFRVVAHNAASNPMKVAHRAVAYHPNVIIPEPYFVSTHDGVAVQFSDGVLVVV